MQKFMVTLLILASLSLGACSLIPVHRPEIEQGNIYTDKEINVLKVGMNKNQVTYLFGTPVMEPSYDTDRWDYVYYLRKEGKLVELKRLTVFFINDKVDLIINDPYDATQIS